MLSDNAGGSFIQVVSAAKTTAKGTLAFSYPMGTTANVIVNVTSACHFANGTVTIGTEAANTATVVTGTTTDTRPAGHRPQC